MWGGGRDERKREGLAALGIDEGKQVPEEEHGDGQALALAHWRVGLEDGP